MWHVLRYLQFNESGDDTGENALYYPIKTCEPAPPGYFTHYRFLFGLDTSQPQPPGTQPFWRSQSIRFLIVISRSLNITRLLQLAYRLHLARSRQWQVMESWMIRNIQDRDALDAPESRTSTGKAGMSRVRSLRCPLRGDLTLLTEQACTGTCNSWLCVPVLPESSQVLCGNPVSV